MNPHLKMGAYYLSLLLWLVAAMAITAAIWGNPWEKAAVAGWMVLP